MRLPSSVRELSSMCFCECNSLRTFKFESNSQLSTIGNASFRGCSSLSSIDIPSSVEALGIKCFCRCRSLSRVAFGDDSKLSRIGSSLFSDCSPRLVIRCPRSLFAILDEYRPRLTSRRALNSRTVCHAALVVFVVVVGILFIVRHCHFLPPN
jgi:hypothetical protein